MGNVPAGPGKAEHQRCPDAAPAIEEARQGVATPTQLLLQWTDEHTDNKGRRDEQDGRRLEAELGNVANGKSVERHRGEGDRHRPAETHDVPPHR